MRSFMSLRIAGAAMLVGQSTFAQESKLEEVIVTATALRESRGVGRSFAAWAPNSRDPVSLARSSTRMPVSCA
jgi:predicted kinase